MCELPATTQPAEDLLALLRFRDITQALQQQTQHTQSELQTKTHCLDILKNDDSCVEALYVLSLLAAAQGELNKSRELLQNVLTIEPENPRALYGLGRVFKELEQGEEALAVLKKLTSLHPDNAEAHFLMATVLASTSRTAECIAAYERSLTLDPDHPGALLGIGHALKAVGRREEAIIAYQRCIALRPDSGEPYQSLANLKNYRFSKSMIEEMRAKVDLGKLSSSSEINFLFALAKAYEDRQDYACAWRFYTTGNAKKKVGISYDGARRQKALSRIRTTYSREFFIRHTNNSAYSSTPIFILGMPRSGSTLIEQILASHSKIEATGELPYIRKIVNALNNNGHDHHYPENIECLKPNDFAALGRRYLQLTAPDRLQNRPLFIDKMPANFWHVGLIHSILPAARFIDARRHPLDTCVGNLKQLYARGQTFSYSQVDIGHYYLQYQAMMDHWDEVLPGKVLRVQYEDTVADLDTQVHRLLEYLELPWEESCLNYHLTNRTIRSASSEQVRQPLYTTGVGFWKNYEPELDELKSVLQPILHRYS